MMRWVKRSLGVAALAFVVLVIVLVVRTARLTSEQVAGPGPAASLAVDEPAAAGRLAGAVRIETVTHAGAGAARRPGSSPG